MRFVMVYILSITLCLIVTDVMFNSTLFTLTPLDVLLYMLEKGLITELLEVPEAFTARLSCSIYSFYICGLPAPRESFQFNSGEKF